MSIDLIPKELTELRQWVVWRRTERNGKTTKLPLKVLDLRPASTTDSKTWSGFDAAVQCAEEQPTVSGIGFVFSPDDDFVGIDLDKCREPDTRIIEPWAQKLIDRFDSYTEISPSGTGVHIIIRGKIPGERRRKKRFEIYEDKRFFCFTGNQISGLPGSMNERSDVLEKVYAEIFGQAASGNQSKNTPCVAVAAAIISKAKLAQNGSKFEKLWNGDTSDYNSPSEADLALCSLLAVQTGPDFDKIDQLFRESGLYRTKWDREDYRLATINKALNGRVRAGKHKQSFALTDTGNAERMVARHGHDFRFRAAKVSDSDAGSFYVFNGKRWETDLTYQVARFGKETIRSMYKYASDITDDGPRKEYIKFVHSCESKNRRSAMIALAKKESGIAIRPDAFDSDDWLLNCLNGTIDLRTGAMREHQREDLITKLSPILYDPAARCPRFLKFLDEIMIGNKDLILWLQRFLGMCLTGDIREQLFPIFHGGGQNGKSVLIDTIKHVMGDYASDAPLELVESKQFSGHPTEIADLQGKRLVIASETEAGRRLRIQLVKRMTGDATLKGRHMREDFFEFPRTHKTILITNNKPVIRESNQAIWRRIRLVPFSYKVPDDKVEKRLTEMLKTEAPGIMCWLVDGCKTWQLDGLPEVAEIEKATANYQSEQDVLADFIYDVCIRDVNAKTTRNFLYTNYTSWSSKIGEGFPMSRHEFYGLLEASGFTPCDFRDDGRPNRGFKGIAIAGTRTEDNR